MMYEKEKNLAEKGWECQRVTILKTVARNVLTEKKTSESSLGAERARLRDSEKYSGREMAGARALRQEHLSMLKVVRKPEQSE